MTTKVPHSLTTSIYSEAEVNQLLADITNRINGIESRVVVLESEMVTVNATLANHEARLLDIEGGNAGYVKKTGDVMSGTLTAVDFVLT